MMAHIYTCCNSATELGFSPADLTFDFNPFLFNYFNLF